MKTFIVLETVVDAFYYEVKAASEADALYKIEQGQGRDGADVQHVPEYDKRISRNFQCEGGI